MSDAEAASDARTNSFMAKRDGDYFPPPGTSTYSATSGPRRRFPWSVLLLVLLMLSGWALAGKSIMDNRGPEGAQGVAGATGPRGTTGPQGPVGADGVPGPQGQRGAQGAAGIPGAIGATGAQGPSGIASCPNGVCLSLQPATPGVPEAGSINITGTLIANTLQGDGANITNVDAALLGGNASSYFTNASNISSGTLADARLNSSVTLQGNTFNGAGQLVQLDAFGALPALVASALTSLNASALSSGTVADARLSANVTLQGNSFNGASQLLQLTAGGLLPALSGINLTSLNGTNISSGTVADARLSANVALQNAANTFSVGQTIQTGAAATVGLVIQGAASQTANLQEWQNSAGAALSKINLQGQFLFNNSGIGGNAGVAVIPLSTDSIGIAVRANASQTGDLLQLQNSAGTVLSRVTSDGRLGVGGAIGAMVDVIPNAPARIGVLVRGMAAQTGDLLQLQNSAGTILTAFGSDGKLLFGPAGAQDTNLYRSAANTLKTDDALHATSSLRVLGSAGARDFLLTPNIGGFNQLASGGDGASGYYPLQVRAVDFTFSGSGGGTLGALSSAGQLSLPTTGVGGGLLIGTDTNLYRNAANQLKTDDSLFVRNLFGAGAVSALGVGTVTITPNSATEKALAIRLAASQTADAFQLQDNAGIILTAFGSDGKLLFGPSGSQDTNLYRSAANTLRTDDSIQAASYVRGESYVGLGASNARGYLGNNASPNSLLTAGASTHIVLAARGAASQSADLLQLQGSDASVLAKFDASGNLTVPSITLSTATAKPTCDSSHRGQLWYTQSTAGVKDAMEVCAKDAADAYSWRTIY